jgi:hypothetical protein
MNSIILVVSSSMLIDFLTGGLTPNNGHYSYIVLPNNVWILINRTGGVMVSVLALYQTRSVSGHIREMMMMGSALF